MSKGTVADGETTPMVEADRQNGVSILQQRLLCPFRMVDTELKPGSLANFGKDAQAQAFIDTRVILQRLNTVLGLGNYSIHVTSLDSNLDRQEEFRYNQETKSRESVGIKEGLLVSCCVTIEVHHPLFKMAVSNVGEKGLDETGNNKVTSAYAQAFKRSASCIGIGSYFYFMDQIYLPYDKSSKKFSGTPTIPDDIIERAIKDAGFKSICEETREPVPWKIAAETMHRFGRVLSLDEAKKLAGK